MKNWFSLNLLDFCCDFFYQILISKKVLSLSSPTESAFKGTHNYCESIFLKFLKNIVRFKKKKLYSRYSDSNDATSSLTSKTDGGVGIWKCSSLIALSFTVCFSVEKTRFHKNRDSFNIFVSVLNTYRIGSIVARVRKR